VAAEVLREPVELATLPPVVPGAQSYAYFPVGTGVGGLHVMKVHETMDPAMAEALVREFGFARKPRREEVLQNGLTYAIGWDEGVLAVYILMGSETVHNKVSYHLSRLYRAAKRGR
jgi:hypothetical protein